MDTRIVSTVNLSPNDELIVFVGQQRWIIRSGQPGGLEVEAHVLIPAPIVEEDATVTFGRPPTPVYRSAELRITTRRRNAAPRLLLEAVED